MISWRGKKKKKREGKGRPGGERVRTGALEQDGWRGEIPRKADEADLRPSLEYQ